MLTLKRTLFNGNFHRFNFTENLNNESIFLSHLRIKLKLFNISA